MHKKCLISCFFHKKPHKGGDVHLCLCIKQNILIVSYHVSEVWSKTIHEMVGYLDEFGTIVVQLYYTPTVREKQTKHTEKEVTQKRNT